MGDRIPPRDSDASSRRPFEVRRASAAGFTLIEILAVALIIALVSALVLPGLRLSSGSSRHEEAVELAAHLELARQRAIMTGQIHRVLIDVDTNLYRIEWLVEQESPAEDDDIRVVGFEDDTDQLFKPPTTRRAFEPIPTRFGRSRVLVEPFFFDGVDSIDGWIEDGQVGIVFQSDGMTDVSQIVISDPDGFAATLDVLPMLDSVRIRHETDDE